MDLTREVVERFWSHVATAGDDECWNWTIGRFAFGHGSFKAFGKSWQAHRFAWTIEHGDIQPTLCVLHRCDNPPCCNPAHLFLGTKSDNSRDMVSKSRHAKGDTHAVRKNPLLVTGSRNPRAVLDEQRVKEMRLMRRTFGTKIKELAYHFGVSFSQAQRIIAGTRWQSAPEEF